MSVNEWHMIFGRIFWHTIFTYGQTTGCYICLWVPNLLNGSCSLSIKSICMMIEARASEMVRQVRQEPYHFLASGQLQFSPDYKAGSKRFRAIMKEACIQVVYYI